MRIPFFNRGRSVGERGEDVAAKHLKRLGFRILHRNLKVDDDEADLIALDPDGRTIVIVEVKSRAGIDIAPEAAIGPHKQRFLIRLTQKLQKRSRFQDAPVRFDAVAVVFPPDGDPVIRHIPSAFVAR